MATKFYLHAAHSTLPSTSLPAGGYVAEQSSWTANATAYGAIYWYTLDNTIGTSQTSWTQSISLIGNYSIFNAMHVSNPLAAQTIASQTITYSGAAYAAYSSWYTPLAYIGHLYIWRPSTGTKVGTLFDNTSSVSPYFIEQAFTLTATSTAVTVQDGDLLVWESWGTMSIRKQVGFGYNVYLDGTTEGDSTSNASYIGFTNDVTLWTPPPVQTQAQAQAAIKDFDVPNYAQAQADIKDTGILDSAQVQAQILAINFQHGRPISDISNNGWLGMVDN